VSIISPRITCYLLLPHSRQLRARHFLPFPQLEVTTNVPSQIAPTSLTTFPPFETHQDSINPQHDSPLEFTFDEPFEFDSLAVKPDMAGAGSPYIKSEPNDFFQSHQYQQPSAFGMNPHHMQNGMNGNGDHAMGNSNFNSAFAPQNMSSSFNMGNSGLADDELLDGITMDDGHHQNNLHQGQFNNGNMNQHFLNQGSMPMSMNQSHLNNNNNNFYSSTPEGAPIQSPFVNDFNYGQFRPQYSVPTTGGYLNGLNAPQVQMERKISNSRSPATPNTPGISNLHLGEPEYPASSMSQQPRAIVGHNRQGSSVNNWENVSNPHSWQDVSPFGSPANQMMQHQQHRQITEVLKSSNTGANGKIASSLPAKMENPPAFQTQEAKRKRRRESHNLVERRRRDNINERIQDLASLVPQHRLEDERVRKHLQTNAPLSPSIAATSISPSQATSLLAGGNGRRATSAGVASTGLPMDDKDKGPNKGDILNGSVSWTRDLLWYLKFTLEENAELKGRARARGDEWSATMTEDERRMDTEVRELMQKLIATGNLQDYSRGNGSGLRVPGHTNLAGDPLGQEGQTNYNGHSISPEFHSGSGGISPVQGYWPSTDEPVFKEEDEFTINDL
jgi:hypothetical protein